MLADVLADGHVLLARRCDTNPGRIRAHEPDLLLPVGADDGPGTSHNVLPPSDHMEHLEQEIRDRCEHCNRRSHGATAESRSSQGRQDHGVHGETRGEVPEGTQLGQLEKRSLLAHEARLCPHLWQLPHLSVHGHQTPLHRKRDRPTFPHERLSGHHVQHVWNRRHSET